MSELDIIRTARKEYLLDADWLENTITALGIYERPGMIPAHLKSFIGGINAAQWPCQVAPYLIYLSDKGIKSYAEIGTLHGGMFRMTVEYLSRFNKIKRAVAVDPYFTPEMYAYQQENPVVFLVNSFSTSPAASMAFKSFGIFDLVLIDAVHTEEAVRQDYELVKDHARLIAFHDICEYSTPGVRTVFDSIFGEKIEFPEQYEEMLVKGTPGYGLGVVINDQL
jgi:hypothetical protein